MHHLIHSTERRSQLDPTGEVNLEDLDAVEAAIRAILDRQYAGSYDIPLLFSAMADVWRAYGGEYSGLLRSDTLYHDLRHALETALTMARMLDGYAASHPPSGPAGIDANHALLGVLLGLFHDIGLLRRDSEAHLWGPALTPIHEERGVEFMQGYLPNTTLGALVSETKLIMATKLVFKMPDSWTMAERTLASMVASADLVAQLSDRYYLEKCRDFLFLEFSAFGAAGKPDSPYPDSQTLLEKTPAFVEGFLQKRLDEEFQGVRRYLRTHMAGADPWEAAREIYEKMSFNRLKLLTLCLRTLKKQEGAAWDAVTHDMFEKTGTSVQDTEYFANYPRKVEGVEVSVFFRQSRKEQFKVSMRSNGKVNVADICALFGGGGHSNAAGCTVHGTLKEVQKKVLKAVKEAIKQI